MTGKEEAFALLKENAYRGSTDAQCKLGLRFELGEGDPPDLDQAIYWYGLAAASGDLFAKLRLSEVQRKKRTDRFCMASVAGGILRDFYPSPAPAAAASAENPAAAAAVPGIQPAQGSAKPVNAPPFDLERELSSLVGLENVKSYLRGFVKQAAAAKKRQDGGHVVDAAYSLNLVLAGSPGTGKTVVARIAARLFQHLGLLEKSQIVEAGKSDLVSEYTSQTSKKTGDVFQSALGGMLVIDEAHTFLSTGSNNGNSHEKEALDAIDSLMERYDRKLAVSLTGYKREIDQLLRQYPGLRARFPTTLVFSDYSNDQLLEILRSMITTRGFKLAPGADPAAKEAIRSRNRPGDAAQSNAHLCRAVLEDAIRNQSMRIVDNPAAGEALITLEEADFTIGEIAAESGFDLEKRLAPIIGLENIKTFLRGLHAQLRMSIARKEMGLDTGRGQALHMVFKGSPGTGKTMMARIIAELLQSMGILRTRNLVETDRGGLVAGYVGQTAEKTRERIREAMDGVLFVDEAYALINDVGSSQGFGQEAIDTLVKDMDDNRDRLVVILAGYSDEMDAFLTSNPGLRSRFPNVLVFTDYSIDELLEITGRFFSEKGFLLPEEARNAIRANFTAAMQDMHFGNGRYARNLYEQTLRNQAMR
ncbi:MAG TPA: AAA family ATPase, partial [Clostridia bacterium]